MQQQCLPLRGHRDDSSADEHSNRGTFLALLEFSMRSGNTVLANHLKEASRNALVTSKTTQNQLIECIGEHIRSSEKLSGMQFYVMKLLIFQVKSSCQWFYVL